MNELIKITEVEGKQAVSAKELYRVLDLADGQFSRWAAKNILENSFAVEGEDFQGFDIVSNGNETKDYILSIDFAKRLAMLARTEKGESVRRYFIECEKKLKDVFQIPKTYSQALLLASKQAEIIENQTKQIEESKPKVEFYDRIIQSETSINMQEVAGVLNIPKMGRNNLFKFLREEGILNFNNIPYRKYIEAGYFEVKETTRNIKGLDTVLLVTLVSQKGVDFIRRKIEEKNKIT
ncbi:MAG TPA: phage antirepressor KilAC domain-containing protein [bacterium]|nr:phage antirepressor KilAC domain-containing protein [bacterium]